MAAVAGVAVVSDVAVVTGVAVAAIYIDLDLPIAQQKNSPRCEDPVNSLKGELMCIAR